MTTSGALTSALVDTGTGRRLDLVTSLGVTPAGLVAHPVFFSGFLTRPDVAAAGLLAVADVAAARYADAGLGARLASLDPVVTASGDRLRFEAFSACNGVYARLDLLPEGLGSAEVGYGTTNVDIGQPLRTALARTGRAEPLHLVVGTEELRASSLSRTHVERKVALPDRWVRGLAEVPALSRSLAPVAALPGPAAGRFLGGLPRVAPPGPTLHLLSAGTGLRAARRAQPGAVALPGVSRLRAADRVARYASRLTLHAGPTGVTGWVLELPGARLTLLLSPDPYRGFSGEGTLLVLLSRPDAERSGRQLLPLLGWTPEVDADQLARRTGLSADAVAAGLAWLAASGRLGHDLAERAWFARELPVDSERVLRRHPRLVAAQALVAGGGVQAVAGGWAVRGNEAEAYAVSAGLECDCPWGREHGGTRGPCKHVLAVCISSSAPSRGRRSR